MTLKENIINIFILIYLSFENDLYTYKQNLFVRNKLKQNIVIFYTY